jgi:hypothetical protein
VRKTHVLLAASLGAVIGVVVSGLWWTVRDRSYDCEGGCSALDKNLPPGDITLSAGGLGGILVAVSLLALGRYLWRRTHR